MNPLPRLLLCLFLLTQWALVGANPVHENDILLLAAHNAASERSSNKSSSGSIGVSVGSSGLYVNVGASKGKGHGNGDDLWWNNTHLDAGNTLTLVSGGDTALVGAAAKGQQIVADIGGDLLIESLQDKSTFDAKQQNISGSLSVGLGSQGMISGSLSIDKSKVNSDFASVGEQSGLKAGDGGFDVTVKGDTTLIGAVIASTDKAVEEDKNRFDTGSELAMLDLENKAHYKAESIGVNVGVDPNFKGEYTPSGSGVGIGSDSGDASSTTQSGISGIAGNKDVRSDDKETGIDKIFDKDKVLSEIEAQKQITQAFNSLAPKAASDYASSQKSDLMRQAEQETDPEKKQALTDEAQKWGPNGSYNMAMNIIIGAAGGNAASAVSKETLSWAADQMRQAAIEDSKKFAGICSSPTDCISNISGESVGVNGDGLKIAGGRIVLADWCKEGGEGACIKSETTKSGYQENPDGTVIFNPKDKQGNSLTISEFVDLHPTLSSPLGAHQGGPGSMNLMGISFNYAKGSFWDKLAEAYAGTHDIFNSAIWYDNLGNGKNLDGTVLAILST